MRKKKDTDAVSKVANKKQTLLDRPFGMHGKNITTTCMTINIIGHA